MNEESSYETAMSLFIFTIKELREACMVSTFHLHIHPFIDSLSHSVTRIIMVTPWLASSAPRATTATPASAESEITPLLASPLPDETEAEVEAGVRYEPISGRTRGSTVEDGNAEPPESPLGLPVSL